MIQTKNLMTVEAQISYLEIALLVGGLFAFSYIFFETTKQFYPVSDGIETVSAAANVCCEETISGNTCQTAPPEQCNTNYKVSPSNCATTSYCEIGCCISDNTGLCNTATSMRDCQKSGGRFEHGETCNVADCKKGCCILGNGAKWTTEKNCKFEGNTEQNGLKTEWRFDENTNTELKCLFNVEKDKEGACTFDSDGKTRCVFTTLEECVKRTGSEAHFDREGRFCSDPLLNTTCMAHNSTGCVTGKEDVYWFDSCGNKDGIKEDCDLFKGSYCKKEGKGASCQSVDCDIDGDGTRERKNGESWCSYDGKIGDGKDPAGSRHVEHICYFGTERLAPCADFRNEICVQEDTTLPSGDGFSQAACRVNQWRTCLSYNKEGAVDKMVSQCTKNPDCWVKEINMAGSFHFKVCLPAYPPGFDLNFEENILTEEEGISPDYFRPSSANGICSAATQRCTETWQCGIFGCICIDNCKCHTSYFTSEMNDFCVSLGDCGAYINYKGVFSDGGYSVKGAPRISNAYSKFAGPQPGQKPANPGNIEFFQSIDPSLLPEVQTPHGNTSALEQELLGAAGAYGSPLLLKILTAENESSVFGNLEGLSAGTIGLSRFSGAVASLQAAINAQIVRPEENQGPDLSMLIALVASLIAYVITQSIVAAMVAALLGFLFGIGWIMKVDIDFTCTEWEPPDGGADCNQCNTLDVPCTEYRCESLGSLCTLINKGTGNELCVNKPANETIPVISPLQSALSPGYAYANVNPNGFDIVNATSKECIEPYTSVELGIKVDPFARCRLGNDSRASYNDMTDLFGPKGNYILPAHTTRLFFPNPEAFKNFYNLTPSQVEDLGKWDLYVKCKTASGKINPDPYHIHTCIKPGPDLTPPRVTLVQPLPGSYVNFGQETKLVTVYVNEPSECRWSTANVPFSEMNQTLSCETNPAIFTQFGWKCTTTLTGLNQTSNFYIKCRDLSPNNNTMTEGFVYQLKPSASALTIDEVLPKLDEEIRSGVSPVSVPLKAHTSGGALNGEAMCRWEGNGYADAYRYAPGKNGSSTHEYSLNLPQGGYALKLYCEDVAGNVAENSTRFSVFIDVFGPKIARVYYDLGLKVITTEPGECRYSFNRQFDYSNATKMSGNDYDHFAPWVVKTYYIQCQDTYGNKGTIVKVKPGG